MNAWDLRRIEKLCEEAERIAGTCVILAHNLTIAAGLCAADDIGHHNGYRDGFYVGCGRMIDNDGEWHPGCGRPAPGWGAAVKLTKQGVRDLNGPRLDGIGYNGRGKRWGTKCRHNFCETVVIGTRWERDHSYGWYEAYEVPIYGERCGWCGQTRPA